MPKGKADSILGVFPFPAFKFEDPNSFGQIRIWTIDLRLLEVLTWNLTLERFATRLDPIDLGLLQWACGGLAPGSERAASRAPRASLMEP